MRCRAEWPGVMDQEGGAGVQVKAASGGAVSPQDSFDVPAPPTVAPVQRVAQQQQHQQHKSLVVPRHVLQEWQRSSFAPLRWCTDFSNCAARGVFTVGVCSPLLPLFVSAAYFDVRRTDACPCPCSCASLRAPLWPHPFRSPA